MSKSSFMLLGAAGLSWAVCVPSAFAQCAEHNYYWAAATGDWSVPDNWEHEAPNPDPPPECVWVAGVPASDDNAWITNGGTATISGSAQARETIVESGGASIVSGSLTSGWEEVGRGGIGTFLHAGGSNTVTGGGLGYGFALGKLPGSYGHYELQDGQLSVAFHEGIGWEGTGVFVHTGGTNTVGDWLGLGVEAGSDGRYVHTGGTTTVGDCLVVGVEQGSDGQYELSGGGLDTFSTAIGGEGTGTFIHTGGTHTTGGEPGHGLMVGAGPGSSGQYEMSGTAELYACGECIAWAGTGTFIQTGGTNTVGAGGCSWLVLGEQAGSVGRYELSNDAELYTYSETIAWAGTGTFIQTGGTNTVAGEGGGMLLLGNQPGSDGCYELSGMGSLSANEEVVGGWQGTGTFIQTGGTNTVTGDLGLGAGQPSSAGTYDLSSNGELSAARGVIGWVGTGVFTQTGGTATFTGGADGDALWIGPEGGSDGRYELTGGTLSVGGLVLVGWQGAGSFEMMGGGGVINGTTEEARMIVNGTTGTLTGAGTFNIAVTYESPKLYGANGDQSVDATFPPNGLTVGGSYDVTQLTPADFAGGTVIGLLPSSVFDVAFEGSFVGDFDLAIPYDDDEVAALGASETELAVLRETGPETWELVSDVELDPDNDYVYVHQCTDFGTYAVVAPLQIVTVIVHGYQDDGTVPQWAYDMENAIVDRTADSYAEIDIVVFDWAVASEEHVFDPLGGKASDVLKREAGRLVNELLLSDLVSADPDCHVHLIGHSRGGSLVSYAAALLNRHFGRRVVNHMTILDGIDKKSWCPAGWYLQDPAICGNNADWTDNYYQTHDPWLHGQWRNDADLNARWSDYGHGGFALGYTATITQTGATEGYYWSLGGGGWDDPTKPRGRAFCSQWGIETVINGDFETQDLLNWSAPLGSPSAVPHGPDNYVCQMEEESSVAISQSIITAAHARFLLFDFAFTVPGDGDYLTVGLNGTTVFTFLGTDFQWSDLVSCGPIDIADFAGQTSCEMVFMLDSVGEPGTTILLDNVQVIDGGDLDFDGDVDVDDYVNLAGCLGGPGVTAPPSGCSPEQFTVADVDGDEDVDLGDYASFEVWFTGSPPGPLGDADGDGDVDLDDFAFLPGCLTSPENPPYSPGCAVFDFDYDGDLDLYDFAGFQAAFTGSSP